MFLNLRMFVFSRKIKPGNVISAAGLLVFIFQFINASAQINAYGKVTAITSGNTVLTVNNLNQTFASFSAGQRIIVIQMQGASLSGSNNNSSFGGLNSLNSAGLYEVAQIQAINGAATSMTLASALVNSYSTTGGLQVVSYPQLGTTSYTTTANITGVSWDGNRGGVIAFYVNGNLYQNHNITANNIGFRGGDKAGQDDGDCEDDVWRIASGDDRYADKGEGIYITTNGQKAGKAKAVNGGGGGIVHNGGGGGGGNYSAGGNGYYGYTGGGYCSSGNNAGGQGGLAVSSNASRVFMGGGGGGGQENNGVGTDGGNGGGIIFISCDTLVIDGVCSPRSITANGETITNSGNDGCGGGGAGGSIVLDIDGMRVKNGCALTISANGGNGGSVNNGASHGAGGGGGQGAIYLRASTPIANVTLQSNNGAGGAANNGGSPPVAGSGGGSNGAGISTGVSVIALPVELVSFNGIVMGKNLVQLNWKTLSEKDNHYFEVLHSIDGADWYLAGTVAGSGTSNEAREYSLVHAFAVSGVNYYKLKQVDFDNTYSYSPMVYVVLEMEIQKTTVYPNPGTGFFTIDKAVDLLHEKLILINAMGAQVPFQHKLLETGKVIIDITGLPDGIYLLCGETVRERIVLKR